MRIIIVSLLAVLSFAGIASAQNLALVLSNGNYENGRDVNTISSRHRQMVVALEAQNYEVLGGRDLNRLEIRRQINTFAEKIARAQVVVVVLNGHITHFGAQSWLLASDIDANTATAVAFRGVDLDFIAELLAQKPGQSAFFVGESDSEFKRIPLLQEGVGRMTLPRGVMMISGNFDKVNDLLRDRFLQRNVSVIDVLRGNIGRLEVEGDIPASLMLGNGRPVVSTPEDIENALGLSRGERRNIQQDLTDLGFDTRGVDGLFGAGTRSAISNWQRRERMTRTGYLNADQVTLLRRQADEARVNIQASDRQYWAQTGADGTVRGLRFYLERFPNGIFANRARAELARLLAQTDEQAWAQAVRVNTDAAYRAYLREYPNGIYVDIARARIGEVPEVVDNAAKRIEDSLRLNSITRLLIEQRVADLGYRTGPRDGNFDLATRQAFRAYQRDRGMDETGYVTAEMIRGLLLGN